MLNGKFFTGLPPKMIDRGSTGGRNRLESHLFWPDDTQVDTAVETRIKRRNSMQLASNERPAYQKRNSVLENDVDTRKRFTQEFSQSSIQFYDNLNEGQGNSGRRLSHNLLTNKKMDVADKPTNTKMQLPESIVNDAYTAAKGKQAYTSKIEFYDYVNDREDSQNNRNNMRKPKMDMNDKREMELNSKNSPKLQVKRDVRSLSEEKEQHKINNRDVTATMKPTKNNRHDVYNARERSPRNEENYLRNRRSVEPRMNVSPKRGLAMAANKREQRYSSEREIYERPTPAYYENFEERVYGSRAEEPKSYTSGGFSPSDYDSLDYNSAYRAKKKDPKSITRNYNEQYYHNDNGQGDTDFLPKYRAEEEMEERMRRAHLKSPPRQQFRRAEEKYCDDERDLYYYRNNNSTKAANMRSSSHSRFDYEDTRSTLVDLPYKNTKRINTDSRSPFITMNNHIQHEAETSPPPPTSPSPSIAESSVSAAKTQRHLRSSLCFNNGEIVGENDATSSPTSPAEYQTKRRNARSSATQRVSVGLPD